MLKIIEKLKARNWAIPTDENGNAMFAYHKIERWINGKENYRYEIWGNLDYRPDVIEGKPVPVGSTFFDWKTWEMYIMRNWGWATKDEEDQPVPVIIPELLSLTVEADTIGEKVVELGPHNTLKVDLGEIPADIEFRLKSFEADIDADLYSVDTESGLVGDKLNIGSPVFYSAIPGTRFNILIVRKGKLVEDTSAGTVWYGTASNVSKPILSSFSVGTRTLGELSGVIERDVIKVDSTGLSGSEYITLSAFEADIEAKLYEYDPENLQIRRSLTIGDGLCTLFGGEGLVHLVAISADVEKPRSAEEGTLYELTLSNRIRRITFHAYGALINGQECEDYSKYIDVEAHSRVELTVTAKEGFKLPDKVEQMISLTEVVQTMTPPPSPLEVEYALEGAEFKIIFPDVGTSSGGNIAVSIGMAGEFEVFDFRTPPDYAGNVTISDMVNCTITSIGEQNNDIMIECPYYSQIKFSIKDTTTGDPVPNLDIYEYFTPPEDFYYDAHTGEVRFTLDPSRYRMILYTGTIPEDKGETIRRLKSKKATKKPVKKARKTKARKVK